MKKILIRTAIVVVSVFALYAIVEASNNTSETKKAKTEVAEELATSAAKASCCDTAAKASCSDTAAKAQGCNPAGCDPATCDKPNCCQTSTTQASCGDKKASTAEAQAGCAAKCGGK